MAINYSYQYENEKRSDQKPNTNLTKVDHSGRFWPGQKAFFRSYPNFKGRGNRPKAFRFWFEWHIDRNRFFHCVTPNSKKGLLNKRHIVFCCGRWVAGDNIRGTKRRPPEQIGHVLNFSVPHPFENTLFLGVQRRPKRHLGIKSGSFQVLEGGLGGLTSTQCIF